MGKNIYVGVDGAPRHVKDLWVGVGGVARNVKAAWVGVNGVARQVYPSMPDWFLVTGLSIANVLAAYNFTGASSESSALEDLTGHGYNLTKYGQSHAGGTRYPVWSAGNGFRFYDTARGNQGYLDNSSLNTQAIRCVVVRYTGVNSSYGTWLVTAGGDNGRCQVTAVTHLWMSDSVAKYNGPGTVWYSGHWRSTSTYYANAVVGANVGTSNQIYINGAGKNSTDRAAPTDKGSGSSWRTFGNTHAAISDLNNATHGGKSIQAAVFYNVALSAAQHAEIYQAISQL